MSKPSTNAVSLLVSLALEILRSGGLVYRAAICSEYADARKNVLSEFWAWFKVMNQFLNHTGFVGPDDRGFTITDKGVKWIHDRGLDIGVVSKLIRTLMKQGKQTLETLLTPTEGVKEQLFLRELLRRLDFSKMEDESCRRLWLGVVKGNAIYNAIPRNGAIGVGTKSLGEVDTRGIPMHNGELFILLPDVGGTRRRFAIFLGKASEFAADCLEGATPVSILQIAYNLEGENEEHFPQETQAPEPAAKAVAVVEEKAATPSLEVMTVQLPQIPEIPDGLKGLPQVNIVLSRLEQDESCARDTTCEIAGLRALVTAKESEPERVTRAQSDVTEALAFVQEAEEQLRVAKEMLATAQKGVAAERQVALTAETALRGARHARTSAAEDFRTGVEKLKGLIQALEALQTAGS